MENGAAFQKSAWKSIFSLCVPALISILVMMLYNMADMYFVGWLGDYAQVASVSLAGPVFSVLMGISTMIGNGGCTKIAQALGRKDLEQVRKDSALCVWASLVSGAVFAAACVVFCDPLLWFLGANAEMWDYTRSYVLIMALGAPVVLLNHSLGGALRGEGEVNAGMVGGMVSTVSNIILDPIFIVVLRLGVGGAAAATVLGNAIALVYYGLIDNSLYVIHGTKFVNALFACSPLRSTAFMTETISTGSAGISMQVSAPWSSMTARS